MATNISQRTNDGQLHHHCKHKQKWTQWTSYNDIQAALFRTAYFPNMTLTLEWLKLRKKIYDPNHLQ